MSNTKKRPDLRSMIECAIMVALATVLSMIKLYEAPLGGSVTLLSMLPVSVLSIRLGLKWGLTGGFLYAMIQMFLDLGKVISWGLTPAALIGCIIFDMDRHSFASRAENRIIDEHTECTAEWK